MPHTSEEELLAGVAASGGDSHPVQLLRSARFEAVAGPIAAGKEETMGIPLRSIAARSMARRSGSLGVIVAAVVATWPAVALAESGYSVQCHGSVHAHGQGAPMSDDQTASTDSGGAVTATSTDCGGLAVSASGAMPVLDAAGNTVTYTQQGSASSTGTAAIGQVRGAVRATASKSPSRNDFLARGAGDTNVSFTDTLTVEATPSLPAGTPVELRATVFLHASASVGGGSDACGFPPNDVAYADATASLPGATIALRVDACTAPVAAVEREHVFSVQAGVAFAVRGEMTLTSTVAAGPREPDGEAAVDALNTAGLYVAAPPTVRLKSASGHDYRPPMDTPADSTPPTTTPSVAPEPNPRGWTSADTILTLTAADDAGGSGVKELTYSATGAQAIAERTVADDTVALTITEEGVTTIAYQATDIAGNRQAPNTLTVRLDKTAPAVTCAEPDGAWHATDVTRACTASDARSGLADPADTDFGLATAVQDGTETADAATTSRTICDQAGNCATAGPLSGNRVDKKAPTVALTCPAGDVVKGSTATASWSASDGGSGLVGAASDTIALDTSSVGTRTTTLASSFKKDIVENASAPSSCSFRVIFAWTGFLQPVDNTDAAGNHILNKAKAGSTIPVKFSLGGDQGLGVLATDFPKVSGTFGCSVDPTSDLIEEYSTATVSGLKYDAVANQYTYNWKTDAKWAGQCRSLLVRLVDGTTHRADFNFFK
jgi:hypothetical protein